MIILTSNDIKNEVILNNTNYDVLMTPLKLPAPLGVWYSYQGSACFNDIVWNPSTNQYDIITKTTYRTQLELH